MFVSYFTDMYEYRLSGFSVFDQFSLRANILILFVMPFYLPQKNILTNL